MFPVVLCVTSARLAFPAHQICVLSADTSTDTTLTWPSLHTTGSQDVSYARIDRLAYRIEVCAIHIAHIHAGYMYLETSWALHMRRKSRLLVSFPLQ
jgi:hypothetical protein